MSLNFTFILILISFGSAFAQKSFHNLNLEVVDYETDLPQKWYVIEESGIEIGIDNQAFSGKNCLLISPKISSSKGYFTIINEVDSLLLNHGKMIKVSVKIKFEDSMPDLSIIIKQLTMHGKEISKPFQTKLENENAGWITLTGEQEIHSNTAHLAFGVMGTIYDTIRIDDFKIVINNKQFVDASPILESPPSRSQIKWIKKACVVLDSQGFKSLMNTSKELTKARVVALGEVTHGSSEIYKVKDMIVRNLVENGGFSILAMEMDMAEAEIINNFLLTGEGNLRNLLMGISYWPWKTEEFLSLLTWMRSFNTTHNNKVQLAGFDIPISGITLDSIMSFAVKYDKELLSKVKALKMIYEQDYRDSSEQLKKITDQATAIYDYLSLDIKEMQNVNQAIYLRNRYRVRSLIQAASYFLKIKENDSFFRDQCMAENVQWILDQNPTSKVVIWAHNAHVSKDDFSMGQLVKGKYFFYSIGFALGTGEFTAASEHSSLIRMTLKPPPIESFEFFLMQSDKPFCFLNLYGLKKKSENSWLFENRKFRYIGATQVLRYQFATTSLTKNFDGIIFILKSTPSTPLVP